MDERVFGPYYGTPPEQQTSQPRTVQTFNEPLRTIRSSLRERLVTRRKRRPPTRK